ncbi:MAG TPA: FlgD immunoglobulin-like domain containing protein [Candidatus Krumholzibacteria bacterium]|nr:FlgD immunoglobulin-like domain containing protein [Candidatus Krumholzibacteria bacterium]
MKVLRVVLAFLVLASFAVEARAQWSSWGALADSVSSVSYELGFPGAAGDGSGGVVVAWSSDATPYVRATHYDNAGNVVWGPVQVGPIYATTYNDVQVVRQGTDWFVAWFDPDVVNGVHIHSIRIAKLNSSGTVVASEGFAVAFDNPVTIDDFSMVARTGGGVAVGWRMEGLGYARLYASDLSSNVDLGYFSAYYGPYVNAMRIVADGSDGVYAIWSTGVYPPFVNAQRYDSSGEPLWNDPATMFSYYPGGYASELSVAGDGSGGLVAAALWNYSSTQSVRVQHVTSDGTTHWNESTSQNGEPVCATCATQYDPQVTVNNAHSSLIVSWSQAGGAGSIQVQKVPLTGSFAPSWGATGTKANVSDYFELREQRIASNINNQTTIAWTYRNLGYTETGIRFQIIGDDGDVELDSDAEGASMESYTAAYLPILVGQAVGAYAAWIAYTDEYSYVRVNSMLPLPVFDVEWLFNPDHCSDLVRWKTLSGTTANKLLYRHIGAANWHTLNATGSDGAWSASFPQTIGSEFKVSATLSGVVWESAVYHDYGECDLPDPYKTMTFEVPAPEAFLNAHPNPFNPQVIVDYGVPAPSHVDLAIFDASGRLIRTLVSGTKAAGTYSETWTGVDERGERVASGVYFSRLTMNGKSMTRKLVMLK